MSSVEGLEILKSKEFEILVLVDTPMHVVIEPVLLERKNAVIKSEARILIQVFKLIL